MTGQLPLFDETPDELWWAERLRVIRERLAELDRRYPPAHDTDPEEGDD